MVNRRAWGTLNQRVSAGVTAQPPDVLFGANAWAWYTGAEVTTSGGFVTVIGNRATGSFNSPSDRYLLPSAGGSGVPLGATLNGHDTLDFIAANNTMLTRVQAACDLSGVTQISVFAVVSMDAAAQDYCRYFGYCKDNTSSDGDLGGGAGADGYTTVYKNPSVNEWLARGSITTPFTVTPGQFYRVAHVWNGTTADVYYDGALFASGALANSLGGGGTSRLVVGSGVLGGAANSLWDGRLAEVFAVVNQVPTAGELASTDLYLKNKYGL